MYKGTSRSLQRKHAVDKPLPTGGYIGLGNEADIMPGADNMSIEDCRSEMRQLKLELAKLPNEIAVARATGDMRAVTTLGLRHQSLQGRISLVKKRQAALHQADHHEAFFRAVKEAIPPEQFSAILARTDEIKALPTPGQVTAA